FGRVVDAVASLSQLEAILEVFDDGERIVRNAGERLAREGHAVAAQARGQMHALAGERPHAVKERERQGHETRSPRGRRVAHAVVGLYRVRPLLEAARE